MIYAEILAGGNGTRMGNTMMPKQFLNLGRAPIIIHTLEKFLLNNSIDKIIIVVSKEWLSHTNDIISKYIPNLYIDRIFICEGGNNRNESIINGIEYIYKKFGIGNEDIIVTHDAVRPFLTNRIIEENIRMAIDYGATDTVIPATDTIVKSEDGVFISEIPLRNKMYQGQTPQSFNIKKLLKLYEGLTESEKQLMTDAAKIFSLKKEQVKLIMGEESNIKITTQFDLKIANAIISGDENDK